MPSLRSPDHDHMPDPEHAVLTHPNWCNPASCRAGAGGPHRSTPAMVPGDRIGSARMRLRVWSPSDDQGDWVALVELVAAHADTGHRMRLDLSVRQLARLRSVLADIAGRLGTP
jgi:hypothetical protein